MEHMLCCMYEPVLQSKDLLNKTCLLTNIITNIIVIVSFYGFLLFKVCITKSVGNTILSCTGLYTALMQEARLR